VAGAVAGALLDAVNTQQMLNGVKQRHEWFTEQLNAINARHLLFSDIRGLGLLIGCQLVPAFSGKAKQISQLAAAEGVMVLIAGGNVLRFAPALNISEEEVRIGLERFARACEKFLSESTT